MKTIVLLVAVAAGFLLGTSPHSVTPPFVPAGSKVLEVPPWPLFRLGSALNAFFIAAAEATTPPDVRALDLSTAYWKTGVVHALVQQGILDAIPPEGASASTIAGSLKLHEPFLARYLNAGAKLGVLTSSGGAAPTYKLTAVGATMRTDAPSSLRDFVLMIDSPAIIASWQAAGSQSLRTGRSGFVEAHGKEIWDYYEQHGDEAATFDGAMTSLTEMVVAALIADWEPPASLGGANATLCDIGGGKGTLLSQWLLHHPHARGYVFDQTSVVPRSREFLAARGLGERAAVLGGSFLAPLPAELGEQCDVFLMKHSERAAPAARLASHGSCLLRRLRCAAAPERSSRCSSIAVRCQRVRPSQLPLACRSPTRCSPARLAGRRVSRYSLERARGRQAGRHRGESRLGARWRQPCADGAEQGAARHQHARRVPRRRAGADSRAVRSALRQGRPAEADGHAAAQPLLVGFLGHARVGNCCRF